MVAVAETIRDPHLREAMQAQMGFIMSARAGGHGPDVYRRLNRQFVANAEPKLGADSKLDKSEGPAASKKSGHEADAFAAASAISGPLAEMSQQIELGSRPIVQAQKPLAYAIAGPSRLRSFGADLEVPRQPGMAVPQQGAQFVKQDTLSAAVDATLVGTGLEQPAPGGSALHHRHRHLQMTAAPRPNGMMG